MDNGQQKKASTVTSQKDNISNSNSRSYTDGCSTVSQPPPPKNLLLTRGFSRVQANEDILAETRNRIESNLVSSIKEPVSNSNNNSASSSVHILNELAYFSFALPNLNRYDDDYKFKEYLQNDLIDLPTLCSLSESGHLNWWQQGVWEDVNRPLYPMVTSGDGNCLLHAASLSMWGLHDRHLALRKALHSTLENIPESNDSPLWRRWKWEQASQNRRYGLILSDEEWSREWRSLLKLSSFQPRANCVEAASSRSSDSSSNKDATTTVYFESLEEFHVFLLAHILQRPIIIVSDTMLHDADGEPLSPIPFGGIYLPLECDVGACYRYPLVLAYDSAHFSALVLMDADNDHEEAIENCTRIDEINRRLQTKWPYAVIPITYSNGELLPVHFGYDPGKDYDWSRFPDTRPPELIEQEETQNNKNQKNNNTNMIDASNNNNNNTSNNEGAAIELSRDERMFLIQRYLDIVKLELYDPGPAATVKRTANVATNSSGMRVNIVNINVPPPIYHFPVQRNEPNRSSKSFRQKFLNMFKKTDRNNEVEFNSDSKLRKSVNSSTKSSTSIIKNLTGSSSSNKNSIPQAISYSKIDPSNSMPTPLFSTAKPIFHKQTTYKSWSSLFDSMNNHICMLGVKLNLARLPKHSQMICNYIDNAKIKYDMLQQQQLQQQQQQQQQKTSISNPNTATTSPQKYLSQSSSYVTAPSAPQAPQEHYCVANRPDCHPNDPCGQCKLSMNNSESSLRSINVNTRGGSINHHQQSMGHNKSNSNVSHNSFSYNQANNNRTANGAVLNSNKGRVVPTNTSNVSTGYYTRPL